MARHVALDTSGLGKCALQELARRISYWKPRSNVMEFEPATGGKSSLGPRPFSGGREKRSGRSSRGHADLRNVNISISAHISDHFPHSTRYPRPALRGLVLWYYYQERAPAYAVIIRPQKCCRWSKLAAPTFLPQIRVTPTRSSRPFFPSSRKRSGPETRVNLATQYYI